MQLLPTLDDRGAERIVLWLANGLDREHFDAQVCSLKGSAPFADQFRNAGVRLTHLDMRGPVDVGAVAGLTRLLARENVDILHTHGFRDGILGRIIGRLLHIPVILSSVHNRWGGPIHHLLNRATYPLAHRVLPFSKSVERFCIETEKLDPARSEVVYIGINLKQFSEVEKVQVDATAASLSVRVGDPIVTAVGALSEQKGHIYLVRALPEILKTEPRLRVIIVGQGPLRTKLAQEASKLGVGDHVVFAGPRRDVAAILHMSSVFAMPSLWEGLSQALLEAMAAGVPVIATAVDSNPEVLRNGDTGLLVPPKDVSALASAVGRLLVEPDFASRLTEAARHEVWARFSVERMISDFARIYCSEFQRTKAGALLCVP